MSADKRVAFTVILVVLILLAFLALLELGGFLFLSLAGESWPSRAEIQRSLLPATGTNAVRTVKALDRGNQSWMQNHVLHPYLGFVRNYQQRRHIFNGYVVDLPVNDYGFFGDLPPVGERDNEVSVAVVGGSVALEFFLQARGVFERELRARGRFGNERIALYCLALGGMKQPQQLMTLNYFLALGRHFDVLINLDGFNEVVLPLAQNVPYNVNPFYPRAWGLYATRAVNIETAILYGEIEQSKERVEAWRGIFSRPVIRSSNLSLLIWHMLASRGNKKQIAAEEKIRGIAFPRKSMSAQETGPPYHYATERDLFADCVGLWWRSSVQLWKDCQANGIQYFHFLQPNQYVRNSKALTAWERRHAIGKPTAFAREGAESGYPSLIRVGANLKKGGLPFFDLTTIFKTETETIYKDNCCHMNEKGNEILATRIARLVAANFKSQ